MKARIKLELITPAVEDNAPIPNLSLATVAALTPPEVEISFTDDLVNPIDLDGDLKDVDLVGITCSTKTAPRAYEIARSYREQGTPVVLGGIHPTAMPEEALGHCDAVVVGEAEESWPSLIEDFQRGKLERIYRQGGFTPPEQIPQARRDIYNPKDYFPIDSLQATRGCPYLCDFCSVRRFFGGTFRYRPLEDVIEEIRSLHHKVIMFADDNIVGHPRYSRELLEALIPLRKRWIGQASLAGLEDEEMIKLMVKSGCVGLLIGFESISEENIKLSRKYQNRPAEYQGIIHNLHRHGIAIWASFLFGFDHDDKEIFGRTVRFAIEAKFFSVVFAILTPYPGTALYERLNEEGRLTDERWWLLKDQEAYAPHFHPRGMTREELREGWEWAWQEYYSYPSILRRFQWEYPPTLVNKAIYFPFNLIQRRFVRKKILRGERLRWTKVPWKSGTAQPWTLM
ncbi:MAG: B12-binding domain-containing radical SAM protein [Deltaproteobacteria bacterium]|nr:B12-binding domain-containing radical SAM protein [Deltaproteobacteria bacterium]